LRIGLRFHAIRDAVQGCGIEHRVCRNRSRWGGRGYEARIMNLMVFAIGVELCNIWFRQKSSCVAQSSRINHPDGPDVRGACGAMQRGAGLCYEMERCAVGIYGNYANQHSREM
jgi:hypothetical protein